nr:hypothetical protein [Pseudomonadota bacterium]
MMKTLVLENSHNQVAKEFKGEIFSEQLISLPDGEIAQAQLSDDGNKALFLLNEQGKDQIYFWENKLGYQKINIDSLKVISNIAFTEQLFFLLAKDDTGKVGLYVWELGFGLNRVGKLELQGSWGITLAKGLADLIIFAKSKDSFAIADDKSKLTSLIHLKLKGHMEEGRYLTFGQRESKLSYEIVSSHSGNISTEAIAGNSLLNTLELDRNKTAVLKKIKLRDSIKFDVNGDKREDLLGFENISQMPLWRAYTYDGYNSSSDTSLSRSGINLNWRVGDGKGVPVAGDYNGDGVLDLATFTPGNGFSNSDSIGQWQIYYSIPYSLRDTYLNPTQGYVTYQLGTNTALPVPADY